MPLQEKLSEVQPAVDGRSQRRIDSGQRLLDAAIELLDHKPYNEISVEDICELAGVGRATFFRAFKSKSGLIVEYNRRLATKLEHQLAILQPPDAIQALRIVASVFADHYASVSPGLVNMALEHVVTLDLETQEKATVELVEILDDIIKKGVAEGSIRDDLPTNLNGCLVLYQLGFSIYYWLLNQESDIHQLIKDAFNGWLYGAGRKDY